MKPFPEALRTFLAQGTVVGDLLLPMHYATPDHFEAFQSGFRTQGLTGESLVSEADGGWHPQWYVIALSGLDDPLFIAAGEADSGYPVYTAPHGAGRWDALQIAPDLTTFGRLLQALAEVTDDDLESERRVRTATGSVNEYWREIFDARVEQAELEEELPTDDVPCDPDDFTSGDLIVTALGPHKLKVVQLVSQCRGLALKDALALVEAPEFQVACGVRRSLHHLIAKLEALGATVAFRPARSPGR